jgi:hypothetical protein
MKKGGKKDGKKGGKKGGNGDMPEMRMGSGSGKGGKLAVSSGACFPSFLASIWIENGTHSPTLQLPPSNRTLSQTRGVVLPPLSVRSPAHAAACRIRALTSNALHCTTATLSQTSVAGVAVLGVAGIAVGVAAVAVRSRRSAKYVTLDEVTVRNSPIPLTSVFFLIPVTVSNFMYAHHTNPPTCPFTLLVPCSPSRQYQRTLL